MRVTIEHGEKKVGFFKKAPCIFLTVEFSETERAVIKKAGLAEYSFYTLPLHKHEEERMQRQHELIEYLLDGRPLPLIYDDLATARMEEQKLRDGLKSIKDAIEANSEPLQKSSTFEL